MTDAQKLEVAIEALQKIRRIDGTGADLSPPGPCFDVAGEALSKITKKKEPWEIEPWKYCHTCKQKVCKVDCCVREHREKLKKADQEMWQRIDREFLKHLDKLAKRKMRHKGPRCECEQGSNGTISGNDGRLEPAGGCPRHTEAWRREHAAKQRKTHRLGCNENHRHSAPKCCHEHCWCSPQNFGVPSPYDLAGQARYRKKLRNSK